MISTYTEAIITRVYAEFMKIAQATLIQSVAHCRNQIIHCERCKSFCEISIFRNQLLLLHIKTLIHNACAPFMRAY